MVLNCKMNKYFCQQGNNHTIKHQVNDYWPKEIFILRKGLVTNLCEWCHINKMISVRLMWIVS